MAARTIPPPLYGAPPVLRRGPLPGGVRPAAPLFRFFSHVNVVVDADDGSEHWIWTAGCNGRGLPRFVVGEASHGAHRWIYIQLRGPLPPGRPVRPVCGRRLCVNPACLRPTRLGSRR